MLVVQRWYALPNHHSRADTTLLQDDSKKRDVTVARSGCMRTTSKTHYSGLRVARSLHGDRGVGEHLLRVCVRYANHLVRRAILVEILQRAAIEDCTRPLMSYINKFSIT